MYVQANEKNCEMEINKKYARTSPSQLRWYIAYVKDHPELLQGKNCPTSPNLLGNMWQEISTNLNAMVGPSRTPDAWRESLRNWRKQLRARARKLVSERKRTGGGNNPVAELNDFEQQALEAFGIAAVEGHSNSRLGFQNVSNAENISPIIEEETSQFCSPDVILDVPDRDEQCAEFCIVVSGSPNCTPSRPPTPNPVPRGPVLQSRVRNRRRDVRAEILESVQEDMRERRQEQARLAQSLENLGNGLNSLASAIHELVALQMQQRS